MSQFRLGLMTWWKDTQDNPQVFYSALIAAVALILLLTILTGWNP